MVLTGQKMEYLSKSLDIISEQNKRETTTKQAHLCHHSEFKAY